MILLQCVIRSLYTNSDAALHPGNIDEDNKENLLTAFFTFHRVLLRSTRDNERICTAQKPIYCASPIGTELAYKVGFFLGRNGNMHHKTR
jgi:hypothetical protein